jgi:hypothetical protein
VERHQVAVLDPVAALGQPERVGARPAADVGDQRRRRREVPQHDLLGALELERAPGPGEAVLFQAEGVVLVQGGVDRGAHRHSSATGTS